MIKLNKNSNNCENKSSTSCIKALALVLLFVILMASMVLKYSVKCEFGISSGFHLDLSPTAYIDVSDSAYEATTGDVSNPSPDPTSSLSE